MAKNIQHDNSLHYLMLRFSYQQGELLKGPARGREDRLHEDHDEENCPDAVGGDHPDLR